MNSAVKTILIVVAVVVVAGVLFIAGYAYGRPIVTFGRATAPSYAAGGDYSGPGSRMMQGWRGPGMMGGGGYGCGAGPGMMGGGGYGYGMGPGMMGGGESGYGMGPGTMGRHGGGGVPSPNATPLTVDEARQAASAYIDRLGIQGLEIGEVMIFDNNAYVVVNETATGIGAFELLVDPASRIAYPEHGANMMWNLKYGGMNHAGMMGRGGMMGSLQPGNSTPGDVSAEMPVSVDAARAAAQAFLDQSGTEATVSEDPVTFYGYYTFDYEHAGKVAGMLSVNGYNSAVLLHTWHGSFIEEAE
jgi:hypothetical protein